MPEERRTHRPRRTEIADVARRRRPHEGFVRFVACADLDQSEVGVLTDRSHCQAGAELWEGRISLGQCGAYGTVQPTGNPGLRRRPDDKLVPAGDTNPGRLLSESRLGHVHAAAVRASY